MEASADRAQRLLGMGPSLRTGLCLAAFALAIGEGASAAPAASVTACGLVPAAAVAGDLGMSHVIEHASTTPDTGSGGRLTVCDVTAWTGSRAKATVPAGTRAQLTIETAEEDTGSAFAPKWTAGEAAWTRKSREQIFEEKVAEAEGYVEHRHVGTELWDRAHADSPGFDLNGYDEIGGHGKRDILVTWRASQPIGRSLSMNMVVDERKHAFAQLNKIAEAAVPAFALSPGEFGSPGPPSPEQRHVAPRFSQCPRAPALKDGGGYDLGHFEVKNTTCSTAVAIMRRSLAGESLEGWTIEDGPAYVITGHKGRARFICYMIHEGE
jgi:hypothetical protein